MAVSGATAVIGAQGATVGSYSSAGKAYVYDISTPASPIQKATITASDGAGFDVFGNSIAISGSTVVFGVSSHYTTVPGAVYVFDISNPASPVQKAEIVNPILESYYGFGDSVAVSGTNLVIGDTVYHWNSSYDAGDGIVYSYDLTNPSSPVRAGQFVPYYGQYSGTGTAVAVTSTAIFVTTPGTVSIYQAGCFYSACSAYGTDISTMALAGEIGDPANFAIDGFGYSGAVSGATAVIGAWGTTIGGYAAAGAAYIFDITNPNLPVQKSEFYASDGLTYDEFGSAMAVSGATAVIGAPYKVVGGSYYNGVAYIFDISNPASPIQKAEIADPATVTLGDYFARAMAVSGTTALIGAYGKTVSGQAGAGTVYIYDITNLASPVLKATITDPGTVTAGDGFGISIAVSGATALIGAWGKNSWVGAVYVYDISTPASPVLKATITASDATANDQFGNSIAVSGTTALIGAHTKNSYSGAVYIFDITTPAAPVQKAEIAGTVTNALFGSAIAVSGATAVIGVSDLYAAISTAYIYDITNPAAPVQKEVITESAAQPGDNFGEFLALSGTTAVIGAPSRNSGVTYIYEPACVTPVGSTCATNGACTSTYPEAQAGSLKYVPGRYFEYCNGANWVPIGPCGSANMAFTNQTNASFSTLYQSSIVQIPASSGCDELLSLSGASGSPEFRVCSDAACSSVVQTWGTASYTAPNADYVQLEMTSPSSYGNTNTATLTAGSTANTWNVSTHPCDSGETLSYTNQTGVARSTLTTSNIVQMPPAGYCNQSVSISGAYGSPQFRVCSDAACSTVLQTWTTGPYSAAPGNYIELELTSAANHSTPYTATLAVGSTNNTWSVTTLNYANHALITASGTWTNPGTVTNVGLLVVGSGGGGGGGYNSTSKGFGGGGGGGGVSVETDFAIATSNNLTVTIGAVGSAGAANGNGGTGGTSTVMNGATTLLSAIGGSGGSKGFTSSGGTGASGGNATDSNGPDNGGTPAVSGWEGTVPLGYSSTIYYADGGAGGGTGGYNGAGQIGAQSEWASGGASPGGGGGGASWGAGGAGGTGSVGTAGAANTGGGGGGGGGNKAGGAGGSGYVIIFY